MHPSASPQTESRLAARHITFAFEPNLPIDADPGRRRNQVRLTEHRAPKEMVDRYAEQMKAGAVFPAIVVNDRHETGGRQHALDGCSRNKSSRQSPRMSVIGLSAIQARSLSVELNQSHGLSMTEDEIRAFVIERGGGGPGP